MLLIHSFMKFEVQPCFDIKSTDQKKDGKKKESKKVLLEGKFSKLLFLNRSYVDCVYSVTFFQDIINNFSSVALGKK